MGFYLDINQTSENTRGCTNLKLLGVAVAVAVVVVVVVVVVGGGGGGGSSSRGGCGSSGGGGGGGGSSSSSVLKLASSICTNNVNHQSKFYLDHVITYSDNSESHLHHLRQVSDRVRQSALTVNLEKVLLATLESSISFKGQEAHQTRNVQNTLAVPTPLHNSNTCDTNRTIQIQNHSSGGELLRKTAKCKAFLSRYLK